MNPIRRREFIRKVGVSAGVLPFLPALSAFASDQAAQRKQRLIIVFTPNGIVQQNFWPEEEGAEFTLKPILAPLEPFKKQLLLLRGISNKVRGDGDSHMRGMSCLLTGIELFPGNIQGGSHTPAGWASGISIDQELKNFFQARPETRTRFGSLELGVAVPNRADPWTRMCYAGPNKPVAPVDDPYQVFEKVYGQVKDKETVKSVMDPLCDDLRKVASRLGTEDRRLLQEHLSYVREAERDLQNADDRQLNRPAPQLDAGVIMDNDNIPRISRMQIDLLVNAFANDLARVATLQYTNSVGNARMRWLNIQEDHHALSHDPDLQEESQQKLTKINEWFAGELASLVQKLSLTKEPGGEGTLLDHTLIVWTNELGKGNSHSLDDIPFVLLGNGCNFKMGRSLKYDKAAHNLVWREIANAMGHGLKTFGNPALCEGASLGLS